MSLLIVSWTSVVVLFLYCIVSTFTPQWFRYQDTPGRKNDVNNIGLVVVRARNNLCAK